MNRAFHIGIVLAVLTHMVCGCCMHHAKAAGPRADRASSVDVACSCEHHGHAHAGHAGDSRSRHNGGNHPGCDGGHCTFTRPDVSGSNSLFEGLQCLPLFFCVSLRPTLGEIESVGLAPSRFGPPISLHLLNQALLL